MRQRLTGSSLPFGDKPIPNSRATRILVRVDKDFYASFNNMYPAVCKTFLRRCMTKALASREFFDSVFFEV